MQGAARPPAFLIIPYYIRGHCGAAARRRPFSPFFERKAAKPRPFLLTPCPAARKLKNGLLEYANTMRNPRARPNGTAARAQIEGTAENMTLAQLPVGQSARIAAVGGEGALRRRLLDMGLTPGTTVMVRKIAPMGDPIELHLRGYELTLRLEDAQNITLGETPQGEGERG